MKRSIIPIILCLIFSVTPIYAIRSSRTSSLKRGYVRQEWVEVDGERVAMIHLNPVYKFTRRGDLRRYLRLVNAVKKVYPIAKFAREKLILMESELDKLPTKKEQKAYVKGIYKDILEEYTPVMKQMTMSQGRVLVRLIDRQTESTAYEVVREFRGGFVASFWQGIGRMFGQDLKSEYGSSAEDKIIEQIIIYYEAGLL